MTLMPLIAPEKCIGCGLCVNVCYCGALIMVDNVVTVVIFNVDAIIVVRDGVAVDDVATGSIEVDAIMVVFEDVAGDVVTTAIDQSNAPPGVRDDVVTNSAIF